MVTRKGLILVFALIFHLVNVPGVSWSQSEQRIDQTGGGASGKYDETISTVNASYLVQASDENILISGASANVVITIPVAFAVPGRHFTVMLADDPVVTGFTYTISPQSRNVNGSPVRNMAKQYESWKLVYTGSYWQIVGYGQPGP